MVVGGWFSSLTGRQSETCGSKFNNVYANLNQDEIKLKKKKLVFSGLFVLRVVAGSCCGLNFNIDHKKVDKIDIKLYNDSDL